MPSNFQPSIPTGRVNLDVDYQNLQDNFQQLDTTFGVNHTKFSDTSNQNGYHTNIQFIPQSPTPPTVAGYGQLFTETINDGYASDQGLFYKSGGGINTLLTRNFATTAATSGATFLPGQIVLNWGVVSSPGAAGSVVFTQDYKNQVFCVTFGFRRNSGSPDARAFWVQGTLNLTGFNYASNTSGSEDMYWMALGY